MRAAETSQGGNVSKQLDWLRHTGCLVVEDNGRTGSDVNLRHDDAGIGAVICDQTAPVDCVGCQGILFRFVKVFLTWKRDMIGQGPWAANNMVPEGGQRRVGPQLVRGIDTQPNLPQAQATTQRQLTTTQDSCSASVAAEVILAMATPDKHGAVETRCLSCVGVKDWANAW